MIWGGKDGYLCKHTIILFDRGGYPPGGGGALVLFSGLSLPASGEKRLKLKYKERKENSYVLA